MRSVLLGRHADLSTSYVFATALLERFADVVALVLISLLGLLMLGTVPSWLLTTAAVAGVVGLVGLTAARVLPGIGRRLIGHFARLAVPSQLRTHLMLLSSQFMLGLGGLRNPRRGLNFTALTLVIWTLDIMFALMVGQAFGLPLLAPQAMLLLAALGFASAVPSTPGFVGVYQFIAVTVLVPFGFSRDQALVQVIGLQGLVLGLEILLGTLGLWYLSRPRTALRWRSLISPTTEPVK